MKKLVLSLTTLVALLGTAQAQLLNPSFEANLGAPQDWTVGAGNLGQVLSTTDVGFPTDGNNYMFLWGLLSGPATPHSNPGGFGTDATNTSSVSQTFQLANASLTRIEFDCIFMGNDSNPDFLEASISDGSQVLNLVHLDTSDVGAGPTSIFFNLPTTGIVHVSVDLGAAFPSASVDTNFTLTLHCGEAVNGAFASRANFDNFTFTPGTSLSGDSILWFFQDPSTVVCQVQTQMPLTEWVSPLSSDVSGPVGGGSIIGLYPSPSIFETLSLPLGFPCIRNLTDINGDYVFPLPTALFPPGFAFDYVMLTLLPGPAIGTVTEAQRIVF